MHPDTLDRTLDLGLLPGLIAARRLLDERIAAIQQANGLAPVPLGAPPAVSGGPAALSAAQPGRLSAEGRERIRQAQARRWARDKAREPGEE